MKREKKKEVFVRIQIFVAEERAHPGRICSDGKDARHTEPRSFEVIRMSERRSEENGEKKKERAGSKKDWLAAGGIGIEKRRRSSAASYRIENNKVRGKDGRRTGFGRIPSREMLLKEIDGTSKMSLYIHTCICIYIHVCVIHSARLTRGASPSASAGAALGLPPAAHFICLVVSRVQYYKLPYSPPACILMFQFHRDKSWCVRQERSRGNVT